MDVINVVLILDALDELSSKEQQERLWLSDGSSGFVSSPIEAFCSLFDDSNLRAAIDAQDGQLPQSAIEKLDQLDKARGKLDLYADRRLIIGHPAMEEVRQLASELVLSFRSFGR